MNGDTDLNLLSTFGRQFLAALAKVYPWNVSSQCGSGVNGYYYTLIGSCPSVV